MTCTAQGPGDPLTDDASCCAQCGVAGGEDHARDEHGWDLTEDGLLCENCLTSDRPTGPYDTRYWG